jgi:nucleoside-diphosphate-sugar epimerase
MKILITGAAGHVATLAVAALKEHHELRLTDLKEPLYLPSGADFRQANVLGATEKEFEALFQDIDMVVHSAYIPSGERDVYSVRPPHLSRFESEFDNIRMAQRIYHHAITAGVRRVVMVSSNHAADWYEHSQVHRRARELISPLDLPLADNFYGWSKASYELLGFPYACGTFGSALEVLLVRIGSPYPIRPERYEAGAPGDSGELRRPSGRAGFKRALGAYLSDRDCGQLFLRAIEAQAIVGVGEVPWLIVYGISDNTRAFWSLESARAALAYQPQDDSEVLYADDIRRLLGTSPGRLGDLDS